LGFVAVESSAETLRSSAAVPPPTVVDRVLKELFREGIHFDSCLIADGHSQDVFIILTFQVKLTTFLYFQNCKSN